MQIMVVKGVLLIPIKEVLLLIMVVKGREKREEINNQFLLLRAVAQLHKAALKMEMVKAVVF
jgi:hypothetical protein